MGHSLNQIACSQASSRQGIHNHIIYFRFHERSQNSQITDFFIRNASRPSQYIWCVWYLQLCQSSNASDLWQTLRLCKCWSSLESLFERRCGEVTDTDSRDKRSLHYVTWSPGDAISEHQYRVWLATSQLVSHCGIKVCASPKAILVGAYLLCQSCYTEEIRI